jgi:hypothetical protein
MRPLGILCAALALVGCASPSTSQSATTTSPALRVEQHRVTLRVSSLGEAGRLLQLQTGILVTVERPKVQVELEVHDLPLDQALALIATQSGLAVTTTPNGINIGVRRPVVREVRGSPGSAPRVDVVLDQSDVALAMRMLARLPSVRLDTSHVGALSRPGPLHTVSLHAVPVAQAVLVLAKANGLIVRRLDDDRLKVLPCPQPDPWSSLDGNIMDGGRTIMTGAYVGHDEHVLSLTRGGQLTNLLILDPERDDAQEALRHASEGDALVARVERYLGRWRLLSLDPAAPCARLGVRRPVNCRVPPRCRVVR